MEWASTGVAFDRIHSNFDFSKPEPRRKILVEIGVFMCGRSQANVIPEDAVRKYHLSAGTVHTHCVIIAALSQALPLHRLAHCPLLFLSSPMCADPFSMAMYTNHCTKVHPWVHAHFDQARSVCMASWIILHSRCQAARHRCHTCCYWHSCQIDVTFCKMLHFTTMSSRFSHTMRVSTIASQLHALAIAMTRACN